MKIILRHGKDKEKEFIIEHDKVIVGRSRKCQLSIPSEYISREHLEISVRNNAIFIKDLTLSNWVSYNDEKLPKNTEIQYYDFAPLILPGSLSLKIQANNEEMDFDSVTKELPSSPEGTNEKMNTDSIDIYHNPLKNKARHTSRVKQKSISSKEDKKNVFRKDFVFMIFLFLAVMGYIFWDASKTNLNKRENQNLDTFNENRKKAKKRIKKESKSIQKQKPRSAVVKKKPTQAESKMMELTADRDICRTDDAKLICDLVLKQRTAYEGAIIKGNTLHVFKDINTRTNLLFVNNIIHLKRAKNVAGFDRVIAGEYLLIPKVMEQIERRKIFKIKIYVFSLRKSKPVLISAFHLDPSYYRRFDLEDYNKAYGDIKKSLNLNYFDKEFVRFLSKE